MDLQSALMSINECVQSANIGANVINSILDGGKPIPKETELWDYKSDFDGEKASWAKLCKIVAGFHNTYGGYILFGVEEVERDVEFRLSGIQSARISPATLRNNIRKYCNRTFDVTYRDVAVECHGETVTIGLLHVPKRNPGQPSVSMLTDAHNEKTTIFRKSDTYFRRLDECVTAKTQEDFQFLMGSRELFSNEKARRRKKVVQHNLPSRNFICKNFVGRTQILQALWAWLGDDFEPVKVLAGEGGRGKTSIAYEFASLITESAVPEFDHVLWLTAKSKQFRASSNRFEDNPFINFSDYESFLKCLCHESGASSVEDLEESSIELLKREAREALNIIPTLVIVDDIDSTVPEDQKKILENVRAITGGISKTLVTTRANLTYSQEIALTVPGMNSDEYSEFLDGLVSAAKISGLTTKERNRLHQASEGSPLFTESIFRLLKLGYNLRDAIRDWRGKKGEMVRDAALKREIEAISAESRKVVLTLAEVGSCSLAELKDYTDLEPLQLDDCIQELGSLRVLQDVPIIETEPRYSVAQSVAMVIRSFGSEFVPNQRRFLRQVADRAEARELNEKGVNRQAVAQAISQSISMMRESRFSDARATIEAVIGQDRYSNNPDLLLMLARIDYFDPDAELVETKKRFHTAYIAGQRKELLFDLWYEAESLDDSASGMVEVCDSAIEQGKLGSTLWYRRAAEARLLLAERVSASRRALTLLAEAHRNATSALEFCPHRYKGEVIDLSKSIIDEIWATAAAEDDYKIAARGMLAAIDAGDVRSVVFKRASQALHTLRGGDEKAYADLLPILTKSLDELHGQGRYKLANEISEKLGI